MKNKQICKNEEIFIEKSPTKTEKNGSSSNSYNKNKSKTINRDFKINKKFFTVRNETKNNIQRDIINNNNNIGYKNIYLKTEIYKNNNINNPKTKGKNNNNNDNKIKSNTKKKKHSKVPKKQPVVNINIDLKDLIKQETMEKILDNNTNKIEEKPITTKEYFDYPEDLKYNVFGK